MPARANPEPLTPEQSALAERNAGLVGYAVNRWGVLIHAACPILPWRDAEEAARDAAVDGLLYAARTYDPTRARFTTYALLTMRCKLLNRARDMSRRVVDVQAPRREDGKEIGMEDWTPDPRPGPEAVVVGRLTADALLEAIPEDAAETLTGVILGESVQEASARVGIARSTVMNRRLAARRAARAVLESWV